MGGFSVCRRASPEFMRVVSSVPRGSTAVDRRPDMPSGLATFPASTGEHGQPQNRSRAEQLRMPVTEDASQHPRRHQPVGEAAVDQ